MTIKHDLRIFEDLTLYPYNCVVLNYILPDNYTSIAEHSKRLIVCDGALNRLPYDSKVPDVIIGDFDSVSHEILSSSRFKDVTKIVDKDEDHNDCYKGLNQVRNSSDTTLLIGALGGRFDQSLCNMNNILILDTKSVMIGDDQLGLILKKGSHEITLPEEYVGKVCGYFPLNGSSEVTTSGFKWDLKNSTISFGGLVSSSNNIDKSTIYITTSSELLFVMYLI